MARRLLLLALLPALYQSVFLMQALEQKSFGLVDECPTALPQIKQGVEALCCLRDSEAMTLATSLMALVCWSMPG
jgi:hypothetical protein